MVKIKVRASKKAITEAQEGGDYGDPPQPGLYHLKLAALDLRVTKDGPNKGGKYLNCRWQPVGTGREGNKIEGKVGSVFDSVSLTSEESEWARARFLLAIGAKPNRAGNADMDIELDADKPGNPVGVVCLGRIKAGTDLDGNYKPQISFIGPLAGGTEDEGAFGEDEEEEEAGADDGADEPFDEEETEEEEDYLTEAQLEAMDNKELGAVARNDFDIDVKAFAKKGRGGKIVADRKGLIAAILEAQGVGTDNGEEADDDPF